MQADCPEQNRPQHIHILRVEIIPHLPIPIQHPTTVHINVLAAKLEERGGVLVDLLETMLLPVVRVVGELDVALDDDVDVLQELHLQRLADDICSPNWEDDPPAVVAGVQGGEDVG